MITGTLKSQEYRPLVFVVEDEKAYRSFLGSALEQYGYDVLMFEHGRQALSIMDHIIPDLVLSDIDMPFMNGFELLDNIKKQFGAFKIPLIYLTARKNILNTEKAAELGSKALLEKPVAPNIVVHTIQQVLNSMKSETF